MENNNDKFYTVKELSEMFNLPTDKMLYILKYKKCDFIEKEQNGKKIILYNFLQAKYWFNRYKINKHGELWQEVEKQIPQIEADYQKYKQKEKEHIQKIIEEREKNPIIISEEQRQKNKQMYEEMVNQVRYWDFNSAMEYLGVGRQLAVELLKKCQNVKEIETDIKGGSNKKLYLKEEVKKIRRQYRKSKKPVQLSKNSLEYYGQQLAKKMVEVGLKRMQDDLLNNQPNSTVTYKTDESYTDNYQGFSENTKNDILNNQSNSTVTLKTDEFDTLKNQPKTEIEKNIDDEIKTSTEMSFEQGKIFMGTQEIADALLTSKKVILDLTKKHLPDKKIIAGQPTYYNEEEASVLVDKIDYDHGPAKVDLKNLKGRVTTNYLNKLRMVAKLQEFFTKRYLSGDRLANFKVIYVDMNKEINKYKNMVDDQVKMIEQKEEENNQLKKEIVDLKDNLKRNYFRKMYIIYFKKEETMKFLGTKFVIYDSSRNSRVFIPNFCYCLTWDMFEDNFSFEYQFKKPDDFIMEIDKKERLIGHHDTKHFKHPETYDFLDDYIENQHWFQSWIIDRGLFKQWLEENKNKL